MSKKQIDKFREAAKELECNDSEKDFDRKLRRIAVGKRYPSKAGDVQESESP